MDNIPQLGTAADLELRAARIADPGIGQPLLLLYTSSVQDNPLIRPQN